MPEYKLPFCWLRQDIVNLGEPRQEGDGERKKITPEMVEMDCHCYSPLKAMFCMEGHMTECHVGMTCEEAECSHWESSQEQEGGFFDESDI